MNSLENKIDFALIFSVKNANPNGDPLNGNRPRVDYDGFGEVTDVCLKRKIRDRLQEGGHLIFVQSDEKKIDGMVSLKARAESEDYGLGKDAFNRNETSPDEAAKLACKKWLDVLLKMKQKTAFPFPFAALLASSLPSAWSRSVSPVHK